MFPNEPVPVTCLALGPIISFLNILAYTVGQFLDTLGLGSFSGAISGLASSIATFAQCPT